MYSIVAVGTGLAFTVFDYALLVDVDVRGKFVGVFLRFEVEYMRAVVTREGRQFELCTDLYK